VCKTIWEQKQDQRSEELNPELLLLQGLAFSDWEKREEAKQVWHVLIQQYPGSSEARKVNSWLSLEG
jgi:TolA-binding protein